MNCLQKFDITIKDQEQILFWLKARYPKWNSIIESWELEFKYKKFNIFYCNKCDLKIMLNCNHKISDLHYGYLISNNYFGTIDGQKYKEITSLSCDERIIKNIIE
jgi:hypothetical protein